MKAPLHVLASLRVVSASLVDVERVQRELTVVHTTKDDEIEELVNWQEGVIDGQRVLSLPRNYAVPWVGTPPPPYVHPGVRVGRGETWGVRSRVVLRENQREALEALLADHADKILCLGCGRGKTTIAIHGAVVGGRMPVLIVVPTTELDRQWRDRIVQFTTCPRWMIGRIQGAVLEVEGRPFVVAILNTASMRDLPARVYEHFALVVFDEGHRLGAALLGRCAGRFFGERWTLTATPERDDGMSAWFAPHLGPVVLRDTKHALTAKVYRVHTGIRINESAFRVSGKRVGRLYNHVARRADRNELILAHIRRAVSKGRTVLVLGERVDQLQFFVRRLGIDPTTGVPVGGLLCGQLTGEAWVRRRDPETGRMVRVRVTYREPPEEMRERRARALTRRVICATSILGKEGLDREALDTVFVPIAFGGSGRLDQSIGRALRELKGKRNPLVVTFVDTATREAWNGTWGSAEARPGVLQKTSARMVEHARELGYEVVEVRHVSREDGS